MDIKSMLAGLSEGEDKKKKYIIIALIILFLLSLVSTTVYFLTKGNGPTNEGDVLSGWELLAPRGGTATSSLKRLPFIELAADHPTVAPGQESNISWVVSNATACVDGNGDPIDLTGSLSVSPTEPYTFDILCTGPNGTQSQTITIGVSSAPIIELIATPSSVLSGKQSYISWDTINADRCEDSKGETLRLTGGFSIKPTTPYTYSMSCTGEKGTTKKSVTVGITSPFASGTGTGNSSGNVFTDGTNGNTYTDTSGGLTGSSSGTDFGTGSGTGGTRGPASTKTNLSGKSFIMELTSSAPNDTVPFGTKTKLTWKVTNLGAFPNSCTIRTSNNRGEPYLPTGAFNGALLSSTKTTHSMTSNETITLACTKGSEEIVRTLVLTVGPPPPLDNPVIDSFSVVVKGNSSKTFARTGSELLVKWETNYTTSKIDKCDLYRNDGENNLWVQEIQLGSPSLTYKEYSPGKNIYVLECTRGEGTDEEKKVTKISTTPDHITIVDCYAKDGFGSDPAKAATGLDLPPGSRYEQTKNEEAVCVYTFGEKDGNGESIHSLWGFPREIQPGSEKFLCPYTAYSGYSYPDDLHTSGNQGLNTGFWRDTLYHPKWEYLDSSVYSHPTYCDDEYGLMVWIPEKPAYTTTSQVWNNDHYDTVSSPHPAVPAHFEHKELGGICKNSVIVVNSLTCLVK